MTKSLNYLLIKIRHEAENIRWIQDSYIFTDRLDDDCYVKIIDSEKLAQYLQCSKLSSYSIDLYDFDKLDELADILASENIYLNVIELAESLDIEINSINALNKLIDNLFLRFTLFKDEKIIHLALADLKKIQIDEDESLNFYGLNKIKNYLLNYPNRNFLLNKFKKFKTSMQKWLFSTLIELDFTNSQTCFDPRYQIMRKRKIYEAVYISKMPSSLQLNLNNFLDLRGF